jgi:predicted DsbA family dithiol-disulfide isomerase
MTGPIPLIIVSDFVCPWCYIGLVEVEKLRERYDFAIRFAPFLLDPSTPPEGKPRRRMTAPDDPLTPMEERALSLGIRFARGRTMTSNSMLAHQAAEYAAGHAPWEVQHAFHRRMFRAYFEDLEDVGDRAVILRVAGEAGLDTGELAEALESGAYEQQVEDGLAFARSAGISSVPTFIFEERYALVGAQPGEVFEHLLQRHGHKPREA